jgi:hypothetical protein
MMMKNLVHGLPEKIKHDPTHQPRQGRDRPECAAQLRRGGNQEADRLGRMESLRGREQGRARVVAGVHDQLGSRHKQAGGSNLTHAINFNHPGNTDLRESDDDSK